MKTLEMAAKIKSLAKEIEDATDRNDHTGAKLLLAEALGGKYPAIMKAIQVIHDTEGHIPIDVSRYRMHLGNEMIDDAQRQWGDEAAQIIKQAF